MAVSAVVFLLLSFSGDQIALLLPPEATEAQRQELRHELHLDEPIPIRFARFVEAAAVGDLGQSRRFGRPALEVVAERVPATLELALVALVLAVVVAVPLGVAAAQRQGSPLDLVVTALGVLAQSMPGFWLGLMLVLLFAVNLGWLPTSGRGSVSQLVLPSVTLAIFVLPHILLLARAGMIEVLGMPYVVVARGKGIRERAVVWRHAVPNVLNPVVAAIGLQFGSLFGGAVITETIFAWPGVGRLSAQAVATRDLPVVEACVLVMALGILLSSIVADGCNWLLDPRLRTART